MNFDRDRAAAALACCPLLPPPGDEEVRRFAEDWLDLSAALESALAGESAALEEVATLKARCPCAEALAEIKAAVAEERARWQAKVEQVRACRLAGTGDHARSVNIAIDYVLSILDAPPSAGREGR